ncbi:MFS transporter [Azorhizobium oxalatiphilum]|uniref:MFS transporter n=1 Tax=Azorhizobium oxalatiphilum TaxID=980631 RepID=A0A917FL39_9HYPH|nr:MFS transporter [Azorhizobium oxalatiphilum]GGF87599.1 MFS transporter [Azorhizobium oxalatiphilum]
MAYGKPAASPPGPSTDIIESSIPARLDRLPWRRFHWLVVVALGITWILDGLEVTLAGSLAGALKDSPVLKFTPAEVGLAGSAYLAGAVTGSLLFGWLADRFGRKTLFNVTLLVYLVATALTAVSWDLASFALFRFLTGAGIGGEYSAINSAIQELIPARRRGWTDLVINGSFWVGAALGGVGTIFLLDPALIDPEIGWRLAFFLGAVLGLVILYLRRFIPESPRWLMTHGRHAEAEDVMADIEAQVARNGEVLPEPGGSIRVRSHATPDFATVLHVLLRLYPRRTLLGVVLMTAQAFFYNAIFFSYAMILGTFYGVPNAQVGWYVLPFAAGNVLGPLLLGRLFDTLGRKPMIAFTYAMSGGLIIATGVLFEREMLDATTQVLAWSCAFFFASAAASSAYLTVAESFPLEIRALAIALFYAFGTGIGGVVAPWLFGVLIGSGARADVLLGYMLAGGLMLLAALVTLWLGIRAERQPLEQVARPLSAVD